MLTRSLRYLLKEVGSKIEIYDSDKECYTEGIIECIKGSKVLVRYISTENQEWVNLEFISVKAKREIHEDDISSDDDAYEEAHIGERIKVWWPSEKKYFEATVNDAMDSWCYLCYDTGDEEWVDLSERKYSKIFPKQKNGKPDVSQFESDSSFEARIENNRYKPKAKTRKSSTKSTSLSNATSPSYKRYEILSDANSKKAKKKIDGRRSWYESFQALKVHLEEHGQYPTVSTILGRWIVHQRKKGRKNLLRRQIDLLDSINFTWEAVKFEYDERWEKNYQLLIKYKNKFGHTRLTQKEIYQNQTLGNWVSNHQSLYRRKELRNDRFQKLENIGFEWIRDKRQIWKENRPLGKVADAWNEKFDVLKDYKADFKNTLVPAGYLVRDIQTGEKFDLGAWVSKQRRNFQKDLLRKEREDKLRSIGFVFKIDIYDAESSHNQKLWDKSFQQLIKYKEKYGDCEVPAKFNENLTLGGWVRFQRILLRHNRLDSSRSKQLEGIGFNWDPLERRWQTMLEHLKKYKKKYGDCLVPVKYVTEDGMNLGSWVRTVKGLRRGRRNTKTISEERIKQLDELDFYWKDVILLNWEKMFEELKEFKDKTGHCRVPQSYLVTTTKPPLALGKWVGRQRTTILTKLKDTGNQIYTERKERMEAIGFEFVDILEEKWNRMFNSLKTYKANHGNCQVPTKYTVNIDGVQYPLGSWVSAQKSTLLQKSKLNNPIFAKRKEKLDEIGFLWDPVNVDQWDRMYERLLQFKEEFGHCRVPGKYNEKCGHLTTSLGSWVAVQLREIPLKIKQGVNHDFVERKRKLDAIDFEWEWAYKDNYQWERNFEKLTSYYKQNGHCLPPKTINDEKWGSLGTWIRSQRKFVPLRAAKGDALNQDRKRRLDAVNFTWENSLDLQWQEQYEALKRFKEENGHLQVSWGSNRILAQFCNDQRKTIPEKLSISNTVYQERKQLLDEIGFDWDRTPKIEKIWDDYFKSLKQYKEKFGNCNVPSTYENGKLYHFVRNQQVKVPLGMENGDPMYKRRKQLLDSIGFDYESKWEKDKIDSWNKMFERLVEYKKEHGNCRVPYRNEKKEEADGSVLGIWVYSQRTSLLEKARSGKPIHIEQKKRLDSIGFEWSDFHFEKWNIMFNGLRRFHAKHGHTRVPRFYKDKENPLPASLGSWISSQRTAIPEGMKQGKLGFAERKQHLDGLKFVWVTRAKPGMAKNPRFRSKQKKLKTDLERNDETESDDDEMESTQEQTFINSKRPKRKKSKVGSEENFKSMTDEDDTDTVQEQILNYRRSTRRAALHASNKTRKMLLDDSSSSEDSNDPSDDKVEKKNSSENEYDSKASTCSEDDEELHVQEV